MQRDIPGDTECHVGICEVDGDNRIYGVIRVDRVCNMLSSDTGRSPLEEL